MYANMWEKTDTDLHLTMYSWMHFTVTLANILEKEFPKECC